MRGRITSSFAFLTIASLGLTACGGGDGAAEDTAGEAPAESPAPAVQQPQVVLAEGVTQEQFDQGRQLFTGQGGCQACHGPQATGTQLAPNLTDDTWLNLSEPVTAESIVTLIKTGVAQPKEHPAPMPPMGGANLSDEQVQALAGYVLSIAGS